MNRLKNAVKSVVRLLQHRPVTANITLVAPDRALNGKTALITGGTSGIGKAIAKLFIEAGAFVVITGRNNNKTSEIAKQIDPTGKKIVGIGLDNSDISGLKKNLEEIIDSVPNKSIDILINNAGIGGGDIRNSSEEEFDKVMSTNLKSVFFLSKHVADHMIGNGIKGNILNIASSSSIRPAISAYMLSKWGIKGLTVGLAKMLAPHGITVNGLAPGPTATTLLGKEDDKDIGLKSSPIGRYALPEEIASMALFLCGPTGKTIVGDIVYMTGGAGIIEQNDIDYSIEN